MQVSNTSDVRSVWYGVETMRIPPGNDKRTPTSGASIVNEIAVEMGLNLVRGMRMLLTSRVPCNVNKAANTSA